jgi:hypothetical protein
MATAREHDDDQLLNERIDHALTELRVGERASAESALTRHAELLSAAHRLTVSAGRTGGIGLALSTGTSPRSRPWMSTCHRLGRSEGAQAAGAPSRWRHILSLQQTESDRKVGSRHEPCIEPCE